MFNTSSDSSINATLNSTLHLNDIEKFKEDCQLLLEFSQPDFIQQVYFDTSSIIDLLQGLEGMFKGYRFNSKWYKSSSTLVNALAYSNWLDRIYTLPPHTDEVVKKIRFDKRIFPDKPSSEAQQFQEDFWGSLDLKILKKGSNPQITINQEWAKTLGEEYDDLFKGTYLIKNKAFWKNRYHYLVKQKEILRFSADADYEYNTNKLTQKPLFKLLLTHLKKNSHQGERSSNNYIDALALSILHERVVLANQQKGARLIPLFFSDQERILKTVKELSKHQDSKGNYYFTFIGKSDKYCVVRDANFFIINGVFTGIKEQNPKASLVDFVSKLQKVIPQQHNKIVEDVERSFEQNLQTTSSNQVIVEFFDRWWQESGFEEFKNLQDKPPLTSEEELQLKKEVNDYIKQVREQLGQDFSEQERRVELLQKTLNYLSDFSSLIVRQFKQEGRNLDAYLEYAPRFYCSTEVCDEVQHLYNEIFETAKDFHNHREVENDLFYEHQIEIVNDLLSGIYDRPNPNQDEKEIKKERTQLLNRLAKSLAILWTFFSHDPNKVELIQIIGQVIRDRFEKMTTTNDKYPHCSFAFFHAASVFMSHPRNDEKALQIIGCITDKGTKNYKVWTGLSYLYYLLWNSNTDRISFPEQFLPYYKLNALERRAYSFLKETKRYSKQALQWLEKAKNKVEVEKIDERRRRYNYALNNYIFSSTYLDSSADFLALDPYIDHFIDIHEGAWQNGNFDDTLARYYYRRAIIADTREQRQNFLDNALHYNKQAINTTQREKKMYDTLHMKIKREQLKTYKAKKINSPGIVLST